MGPEGWSWRDGNLVERGVRRLGYECEDDICLRLDAIGASVALCTGLDRTGVPPLFIPLDRRRGSDLKTIGRGAAAYAGVNRTNHTQIKIQ